MKEGSEKFCSESPESHAGEDFDMSLRLQVNGHITKLAAWAGEGFKESISLPQCVINLLDGRSVYMGVLSFSSFLYASSRSRSSCSAISTLHPR
jgi:hypothetical protein